MVVSIEKQKHGICAEVIELNRKSNNGIIFMGIIENCYGGSL